jgi:hypothetical protein
VYLFFSGRFGQQNSNMKAVMDHFVCKKPQSPTKSHVVICWKNLLPVTTFFSVKKRLFIVTLSNFAKKNLKKPYLILFAF